MPYTQKVFLIWSHCQQKVPNHSPEYKIRISCLLLGTGAGNSNFLLRRVIWHLLLVMVPIKSITSEIKQPLASHCNKQRFHHNALWDRCLLHLTIIRLISKAVVFLHKSPRFCGPWLHIVYKLCFLLEMSKNLDEPPNKTPWSNVSTNKPPTNPN